MVFPYGAHYNQDDVISIFDAIAPVWKKSANEVTGLDVAKLFATLERVYEEWKKLEAFNQLDRELQALLAMATATSWFTKEQAEKIDTWLAEVADCGEEEEWMENFSEEDVREVVLEKLKAREVTDVNFDSIGKAISVEYSGGNYGTGKHNGSVHLSNDGLKIYDQRQPGKAMLWQGELPENAEQLGQCLTDHQWEETWEEEEW
eukprot:TRINITY_DN83606_c0_g1_i1.p1 TRINITY_DN83606_c0_g1~~TRINITY_DN83606_c0_g1_i1.p1  ORF type:complete len:222 (+),score=54.47 TRINITY_DN83606_c0_g1_i1:56-667(+)